MRVPPTKINLRLILVTGKTKDFLFDPSDSASDIAQYVFDHWPQGKKRHMSHESVLFPFTPCIVKYTVNVSIHS